MSVQSLFGSGSLVAIGIGAGDVATLYTVGRRLGNWLTAPAGDAELLALLEEDEFEILRRRGLLDITRFKARWDRSLRLLENGTPRRFEGDRAEKLLQSSSRFTAIMICIVAALDEFASSSTVRDICKIFLGRLLSGREGLELTEELLNSMLGTRINGWRSAATVREINLACRKLRADLLRKGFIIEGFLPKHEAQELADFLFWLVGQSTETYHTAFSDVAGIAYCLCRISFEILTVHGFGRATTRETTCRLIYDTAPLFSEGRASTRDSRQNVRQRVPSTTVSLTQPEETFSTFPISRELATTCRTAWEEGAKAGKCVILGPSRDRGDIGFTNYDFPLCFTNAGTPLNDQRRTETKWSRFGSTMAVFNSQEVHEGLQMALLRESPDVLDCIIQILRAHDESKAKSFLNDAATLEAFTVFQAFFMGYYYRIFSNIVDTSMLEIKSISGCWGYGSAVLFRKLSSFFHGARSYHSGPNRKDIFLASRSDVLSLIAKLYANMDIEIPPANLEARSSQRELCVGVIGKQIVLTRSLVRPCDTLDHLASLVVLDVDSGGIPRSAEGLILTGVQPPFPTWEYRDTPASCDHVTLTTPGQDCTRHIEAEWDGMPERLLLCIRYNGRRVGSLNPAHADITFWESSFVADPNTKASIEPIFAHVRAIDGSIINQSLVHPETRGKASLIWAHECRLDDFTISRRLVTPGRDRPEIPVVVHSKGAPTLRYAAASWYADVCDVVLVEDNLQNAFVSWSGQGVHPGSQTPAHSFVALIG